MGVSVPKMAQLESVFVLRLDIGRRHADGAVSRVVVGVDQVLDDVHPTHGASVRQICPYHGFDGAVKSLFHGCLLLAFTGKMLDTVTYYQGLKFRVNELIALVGLKAPWMAWVRGGKTCLRAAVIALAFLEFT